MSVELIIKGILVDSYLLILLIKLNKGKP